MNGVRLHTPDTLLNTFRCVFMCHVHVCVCNADALWACSGQPTQQAISAHTNLSATTYGGEAGAQFSTFGMEYFPEANPRESYITWNAEGMRTWTMTGAAIGADNRTEIQQRLISAEPMVSITSVCFDRGQN